MDVRMEDAAPATTTEDSAMPHTDWPGGSPPHDDTEQPEDAAVPQEQEQLPDTSKTDHATERAHASEDEEDQEKPPQPQQYSTRGRTSDHVLDPLERLAHQALGDLPVREPTGRSVLTNSFLSDSITEEERRTRTRYIPAVEGMHALRKQQIKADLALMTAALSATATKKSSASQDDADDKEEDGRSKDSDVAMVDADTAKRNSAAIQIMSRGGIEFNIPTTAFAAPVMTEPSTGSTDPTKVDSITAFNPPRPPESVGSKKKHRMIRWERRPSDIDVDLRNYRRTVQKTREELTRAQMEIARVHSVEALIRRNYYEHLHAKQQEWKRLSDELDRLQQACIDSAGLTTTRTRNRGGSSKSNSFALMREVLAVVRAKGREMEAKGLSTQSYPMDDEQETISGVGGIPALNFKDWDRQTVVQPTKLASAWIVPGDKVATPYGKGEVVAVLGIERLDPKKAPPSALHFGKVKPKQSDNMEVDEPSTEIDPPAKEEAEASVGQAQLGFLLPRLAVQLTFGIGFFPVDAVKKTEESILSYSETRLAQRWKGIADTALAFGEIVDSAAMDIKSLAHTGLFTEKPDEMELGNDSQFLHQNGLHLIPFGSGMIPSAAGRGALLTGMTVDELDKEVGSVMYRGAGILGRKEYEGVTKEIREREDVHEDILRLEATVLQLKNQLYRQRRLRLMNERTYASIQERATRVEGLVAEMRTDLKTLKRRLDEDVADLGINEEQSGIILKAYYDSLDYKHAGESSPPKRAKKDLQDVDSGYTDEEDDITNGTTGGVEAQAATSQEAVNIR